MVKWFSRFTSAAALLIPAFDLFFNTTHNRGRPCSTFAHLQGAEEAAMANVLVKPSVLSVSRLLLLRSPKPSSSLSNASSALRGFHNSTNALSNRGLGLGLAGGAPTLRFSIRAAHVNDAGSIDSPLMLSMRNKIKEHLKAESVVVKDAYGDGRHVRHVVNLFLLFTGSLGFDLAKRVGCVKPRLLETNDMPIWAFRISIDVVASSFEGQSAVNRQRMVYKAIWEELQSTVHAVDQMTTRTPAEAASD
ncbi:uncharacterized protein J3R85_007598 [Psidium guajava]|nr:uncharacterized protein J3R85_007598 [Psidium guajava]